MKTARYHTISPVTAEATGSCRYDNPRRRPRRRSRHLDFRESRGLIQRRHTSEYHDVSNHQQVNSIKQLVQASLQQIKRQMVRTIALYEGNTAGTCGLQHKRPVMRKAFPCHDITTPRLNDTFMPPRYMGVKISVLRRSYWYYIKSLTKVRRAYP